METDATRPVGETMFPLPAHALARYFDTFGGFSNEQLDMVRGSNLSLADPTDLAYPLLNLHLTPELLEQRRCGDPNFEARSRAYRAGVCVGLAIVRGRVDELNAQGAQLPPLTVDPSRRYAAQERDPRTRVLEVVLRPLVNLRQFRKEAAPYEYAQYFESVDSAIYMGYLITRWLGEMDFTQVDDIAAGNHEYVGIGLHHTFALANAVQGNSPVERHALREVYDPKKHFLIGDRLGRWDMSLRLERMSIELGAGDLHAGPPNLRPFLESRRLAGFSGTVESVPVMRGGVPQTKFDKHLGQEVLVCAGRQVDIWGDATIPAGTQLRSVRRFESTFVMNDPAHVAELTAVGLRDSVQEFNLGKNDIVIVRGRDGLFATLPYPFLAPLQLADKYGCMQLFALCRGGEAHFLQDVSGLPRADVAALHDVLGTVTEFQEQRGVRPWLGRLATRDGAFIGLPVAASLACGISKWELQTAGLATSALVLALLCALRNRQHKQVPRIYSTPSHSREAVDE